jgi:hypothetical protein
LIVIKQYSTISGEDYFSTSGDDAPTPAHPGERRRPAAHARPRRARGVLCGKARARDRRRRRPRRAPGRAAWSRQDDARAGAAPVAAGPAARGPRGARGAPRTGKHPAAVG